MSLTYSVEIDCPPGMTRPSNYFESLCQQCDVDSSWFDEPSKCFGNWTWTVKSEYTEDYKQKRETVQQYLTKLHRTGAIRYASW